MKKGARRAPFSFCASHLAKKWPVGTWLYEEATHHARPADPTDPGDAADLSKSMGYSNSATTAHMRRLPRGPIKPKVAPKAIVWFTLG
jgi:hypothetical protein